MANWTLLQAQDKAKFFMRALNQKFFQDDNGLDTTLTDLLNEGIADMCSSKAPYMLWDNHVVPCVDALTLFLDPPMLSIKQIELLTTLTDEEPIKLRRPEDYDIHGDYLRFVEPQTGIIRILATMRPAPLVEVTDLMPFGSPFQLAVIYYAVAAISLSGGNAGVAVSGQYMTYYQRIKNLWENQTQNEATFLRGQDNNPANSNYDLLDIPLGRIEL